MQEAIFFIANVDKRGIEAIDNFADRTQINVSHLKLVIHPFGMELHQLLFLQ